MSFINYSSREINCKIVYYGPGLCGKTTNLQYNYRRTNPDQKGKLISLATETERTLFFDFLALALGDIKGFRIRFHLYTVPGQVFYAASRKPILKGVDGVVFVADSQPARLERAIEEALRPESGGAYEAECRVVKPDGTFRWVTAMGQAYSEGEGKDRKAVRFLGTVQDATSRKQAEHALRESEEEFRLVFEHSNDGIFWFDGGSSRILRCNRKSEELTGRTREELVGMHRTHLHPRGEGYTDRFRRTETSPAANNLEMEICHRTGKRTSVLVNSSAINIGQRKII